MNKITGFGLGAGSKPSPADVLNVEDALENLGGSVLAYRDVALVFLEQLDESQAALGRAGGRPDEMLAVVHELASSLGAVGAVSAYRFARAMEASLRRGEGLAAASLSELQALLAQAAQALSDALRTPRFEP